MSILLVLAAAGQFILNKIFRIQLCALEITGGIILFMLGLLAVQEGRFINKKIQSLQNLTELSIVPLAAPLIAGPGTITAVIAESISKGFLPTSVALIITTIVNFLLMAATRQINFVLIKMHLQGPLIRFTGLIIAAVSVQMVINGLRHFILRFS